MKKYKVYLLYFAILSLMVGACKDVFEEDLSKQTVNILAPADNIPSNIYTQTFRWDAVESALKYEIQIVSPKFDSIVTFVLDTTITADKFTYTLSPGTYQWKIRAVNGSSETPFVIRNLIINTASLNQQTVTLSSPANDTYITSAGVTFNWNALYGATKYLIQLDTTTGNFVIPMTKYDSTANNFYSYSFAKEGVYKWRVSAKDATQQSLWSSVYTITYDVTPPAKVTLSSPADNSILPKPVTLQWNTFADANSYQLYVYTSDLVTLYAGYPKTASSGEVFNIGNSNQVFYWAVQAVDKAGNVGVLSDKRKLTIQ